MKITSKFFVLFVAYSCCSPYHKKWMDPIFLEEKSKLKICLFSHCARKSGDCEGVQVGFVQGEYGFNSSNVYKVGYAQPFYLNNTLIVLGGNVLLNKKKYGGSVFLESSLFSISNYKAGFAGSSITYRGLRNKITIMPYLGFAIPINYLNNFQLKYGYETNLKDIGSNYLGINYRLMF